MGLSLTGRDHFIVEFARKWQIGQPIAVDVTHLLAAVMDAKNEEVDIAE